MQEKNTRARRDVLAQRQVQALREGIAASLFRWHDRLGPFLLLIVVTSLVEGASYFYNVAPIIVSLGLAS